MFAMTIGLLELSHLPCHLSERAGQVRTFDSDRGDILVFGSESANVLRTDSWVYSETNGASWIRLFRFATNPPPPSAENSMVYDSARHRLILLGGVDSSQYFNRSWVYTRRGLSGQWTLLSPPNYPPNWTGLSLSMTASMSCHCASETKGGRKPIVRHRSLSGTIVK